MKNLIDSRSSFYLKKINESFSIKIRKHKASHIHFEITERELTLNLPTNCNKDEFTIELLKIYLICENVFVSDYLQFRYQTEPLLNWTLPDTLFSWMAVQLETIKVMPLYLAAGFSKDSLTDQLPASEILPFQWRQLNEFLKRNPPQKHGVILFLNRFTAIQASKQINEKTSADISILTSIRPDLYKILDSFFRKWESQAFEDWVLSYKEHIDWFMAELGGWNIENVYCKKHSYS